MKTSKLLSSTLFSLALLCNATFALAQKAERPSWNVGDTWEYKLTQRNDGNKISEYEHQIEKIDDGKLMIRRSTKNAEGIKIRGGLLTYTADMNYQTVSGKGTTSSPDSQLLNWPIESGKKYSAESTWINTNNAQNGSDDLKVQVSELEDVTVPAGTFKAYKVSAKGFWNRRDSQFSGSGQAAQTIWYAPEIKRWVKWETQSRDNRGGLFTDSVAELIKYTPGK
jgi:hypothetical protein